MSSNPIGQGYTEPNSAYYLDQVRRFIAQNKQGKTSSTANTPHYGLPVDDTINMSDSASTSSVAIETFKACGDKANRPLWLNFDQDLVDDSGNNAVGTLTGTAAYTASSEEQLTRTHSAFSFDGVSYITFNDTPYDFERTDSFSVSYWKKQTDNAAIYATISKRATDTASGWSVQSDTSGHEHFDLVNTDATNELDVRYALDITDGLWRHFCWVYTGTSIPTGVTLYVNGASVSLTTVTNNLTATILNATNLVVGAHGTTNIIPDTTLLDDIQIWSVALSSANATRLAQHRQISHNASVTNPSFSGFFDLGV